MSQVWLVTGASRGLGLTFCRQLLSKGCEVIAACRNPSGARELWELKSDYPKIFDYVELDVADEQSVKSMAKILSGKTVDVLVNNAGILKGAGETIRDIKFAEVLRSFEVNSVGPMRVVQALLPMLEKSNSPRVINMSSRMGSIEDNTSGGYYGYRMSKTALNMFNKSFVEEFPNIVSVVMHPGWVKTEMGGPSAPLERADSVAGMISVISGLKKDDSGKFLDYSGKEIPW
jgi:NAD(P)-dependent dehydrogenase (short-subunit alcohol dehydrogenase family)